MANHPYPPLPEPAELGFEATEGVYLTGYTADDMRAYVDADREQRKPLTDEPQILPRNGWIDPATGTRVPTWEQIHEAWYRIGADIHGLSWEKFTTALRKENTVMPPRPGRMPGTTERQK